MDPTKKLLDIMARLRCREGGCPWDVEQSFETIAPYTIEEAYEVDDAIRRGDRDDLREELGDLLLQVVFHAQMAHEEGSFDYSDVLEAICGKLVRRHPHVFGDAEVESAEAQLQAWSDYKAEERAEKAGRTGREPSVMDDVPAALPALLRATKLQRRAEQAGLLELTDATFVREIEALLGEDAGKAEVVGALLFACVHVAAKQSVDPETAAREAAARFEARFRELEQEARRSGLPLQDLAARRRD